MTNLDQMKDASIRRVVGPTILLGSGHYFDFENPEGSRITIEDYAYGLAYAARFAGQTYSKALHRRAFYSVAQHVTLMSHQVEAKHAYDALMHESGEPVCGDMTGPLKSICPDYKAVEKRCERAIAAKFHVPMHDPDLIKLADLRMLATERRDLMNWQGEEWSWDGGAIPFDVTIVPVGPEEAAAAFLKRFYQIAPIELVF